MRRACPPATRLPDPPCHDLDSSIILRVCTGSFAAARKGQIIEPVILALLSLSRSKFSSPAARSTPSARSVHLRDGQASSLDASARHARARIERTRVARRYHSLWHLGGKQQLRCHSRARLRHCRAQCCSHRRCSRRHVPLHPRPRPTAKAIPATWSYTKIKRLLSPCLCDHGWTAAVQQHEVVGSAQRALRQSKTSAMRWTPSKARRQR